MKRKLPWGWKIHQVKTAILPTTPAVDIFLAGLVIGILIALPLAYCMTKFGVIHIFAR